MDRFLKGRSAIDIVAKISAIIILLFICYKNLTYEQKFEAMSLKLAEAVQSNAAYGLPEPVENAEEKSDKEIRKIICRVYITGEVNNPGMYDMEFGSRIADLIETAGGATEDANIDIINLAAFVEDAAHVKVPYKSMVNLDSAIDSDGAEQVETMASGDASQQAPQYDAKPAYTGPVNINTAGSERLMSLPGIGQAIANGIIQYREQNGAFNSPEEIKNVSRIGDSLYNNIKDMITY